MDGTIAAKLKLLNFKYITEVLDDKMVYKFVKTDNLVEVLNLKFSKDNYFVDNSLRF